MAEKRILIADADSKAQDEFRQALGEDWSVVAAATGSAALAEVQKEPFQVIVANYELPDLSGAELLNRIRVANPKTMRFLAAAEALKENLMCHVLGGHQFLSIPFDHATIKGSIERSLTSDYGMSQGMRELVGRIRTFPTIPSLYLEVVSALKDPNATTEDIGAIIAKDMAMTTKLVQVLNSAYFGLPRTITDPTEAVGILGFETVTSLIMTVKLLSQYDKVKPVYFSIDNIWRHSTNVARTAKIIALLETGDNDCSGVSYTAGLMHDLGKVILAANFDSQYQGAHTVSRKQQVPLWDVEKDIFGVTHGEIGAYLLGLWGMSSEVVKVAALHHYPLHAGDKSFTALTAVHVANALEYEGNPDPEGLPSAVMDAEYLKELGLTGRVELWRGARNDPEATKGEILLQRAKSTLKPSPKPVRAVPATAAEKFAPSASLQESNNHGAYFKWVGLGLGVAAVLALLAWLEIARLENTSDKPDAQQVADSTSPSVKHELAVVAAPAKSVEDPKPAPVSPAQPAPVANTTPATNSPAVAAVPPKPVPVKTALDKLKLQAIFYSSQHPSALISGTLASVDEQVAECRVLDISPSSVTLEYQHQRKTLTLR